MSAHSSTSCSLTNPPLFPPFSFPLRRENYCPDVKHRIILSAPFSGSRLMLAPWRAELGFCFHPVPLLNSLCGDEKPQPFGLGAQLILPVQQVLVCGQNSPSLESKGHSEFSAALKAVVPSDIICVYIVNKCVCLKSLWESQDLGHCL